MLEFQNLTPVQKEEITSKGRDFYQTHRKDINKRVKGVVYITAPSGSDLFHPELWKESHWNWFLLNLNRR